MSVIKKLLSNGDLAIIQDDGSHVLIDPDGNVKNEQPQSFMQKAAGVASKLTREFTPAPTEDLQKTPILGGNTQDVVTAPIKPLQAIDKYATPIGEAGRQPFLSAADTIAGLPTRMGFPKLGIAANVVNELAVKPAIRMATPFTPTEIGGALAMSSPFIHAPETPPPFSNKTASPPLTSKLPIVMQGILDDFQLKFGRKPNPEEIGQILKQKFESGYSPQESDVVSSLDKEKSIAKKNYESSLNEEKLQNERAKFQADETNLENQRRYESEQLTKKENFNKTSHVPLAKLGGEAIDTQSVGIQSGKDIRNKLSVMRNESSDIYEQLGEKMGDSKPVKGSLDKPIQTISSIFEQQGINTPKTPDVVSNQLIKKTAMREFDLTSVQADAMLETAKGINSGRLTSESVGQETLNAYKRMNEISSQLSNPDLTNKDLSLMRTDVGRYAFSGIENPIKNVYKGLYHTLTEAMDKNAEAGGFSKLSKGARNKYKILKDFQESDVVKALDSKDPSELLKFYQGTPERIYRVMEHLTPETKSAFQRGHLTEILKPDAQGMVQAKDVARRLNSASPEKIRAIYDEKSGMINAFKKYADIVDKSDGFKPEPIPAAVSSRLDVPVLKNKMAETMAKTPQLPLKNVADMVRKSDPSKLVNEIMSKKSIETLRGVMDNLDDQGKTTLKAGVWDEIGRDSIDEHGNTNLGKIATKIQSIESDSPGWLKTLYGKDYQAIPAMQKLSAYIDENLGGSLTKELGNAAASLSWPRRAYNAVKVIVPRLNAPKDIRNILSETNAPSNIKNRLFPVLKK